jgi:hypothetical protein
VSLSEAAGLLLLYHRPAMPVNSADSLVRAMQLLSRQYSGTSSRQQAAQEQQQ